MHEKDERPPNEKSHAYHFLLTPNAYLKDGVCKFVV